MGPDGAAAGSQGGSAGARLEGGRSTGIAPVSGAQPEQRKGDGFVRVPGAVAGRVCNSFRQRRSEADMWGPGGAGARLAVSRGSRRRGPASPAGLG
jgi:hypothetical protein